MSCLSQAHGYKLGEGRGELEVCSPIPLSFLSLCLPPSRSLRVCSSLCLSVFVTFCPFLSHTLSSSLTSFFVLDQFPTLLPSPRGPVSTLPTSGPKLSGQKGGCPSFGPHPGTLPLEPHRVVGGQT